MAYVGRFRLTAASFSCLNKNVFFPGTTTISMLNTVASNANEETANENIKKFTDIPGPLIKSSTYKSLLDGVFRSKRRTAGKTITVATSR